jgi:integrase
MGTVYQRQRKYCRTCARRLDDTAEWKDCEAAGHKVELRTEPIWWIKYHRDGRAHYETANTDKKAEALKLLKLREGDIAKGIPVSAKISRLLFEEAADDIVNDHKVNAKRSLKTVELRLRLHLKPFFGGRRMLAITTVDVRRFVKHRQDGGASNGEINRELTHLKRMFTLAVQAGKLVSRPYIPMLKENNVRKGFFEREQFENIRSHLPAHMRGIAGFAYITGWRTPSEILPLEWRQVDMKSGEVRLDPGTTKNDDGRVFPFTTELRQVLEEQEKAARLLQGKGIITPYVFFYPEGGRFGGRDLKPGRPITEGGYNKAWSQARTAAGCPGRIPHDFRRTAVRNLERRGVSRSVAMKLTGHKTEAVYRRYAIVSSEDLRDAVRRLESEDRYPLGYPQPNRKPASRQIAQKS